MRPKRLCCALAVLALARSAGAQQINYVVDPAGDDDGLGTAEDPWATLQAAADRVEAGSIVSVRPGDYAGFHLETSGTPQLPIVFSAEPGVRVTSDNETTPDGINLERASFVRIEGFEVVGASRTGIRAVLCEHVTIRDNRLDENGTWGILTGFCDDLLIEDNEASRSGEEHGIYVSNSGDRPVIRGNRLWGNNANGLHMNGDEEQGGDGVISEALVEANVIWDNGAAGGSGINCDGVQDSIIRNNLLYAAHASGISLYRIDGGEPSTGNLVVNNTVLIAEDGRWGLNIVDASTGNRAYNNIFWSEHGFRGAITITADSLDGFESNNNAGLARFSLDGGDSAIDLTDWQSAGFDSAFVEATPDELFEDPGTDDYRLAADSPARDAGNATTYAETDIAGNGRPQGEGVDIGAFEYCEGGQCEVIEPVDDGAADAGPGDTGASDAGDGGADAGADAGADSGNGGPGDEQADFGGFDTNPPGPEENTGSSGQSGSDDSSCACAATGGNPLELLPVLLALALMALPRRRG